MEDQVVEEPAAQSDDEVHNFTFRRGVSVWVGKKERKKKKKKKRGSRLVICLRFVFMHEHLERGIIVSLFSDRAEVKKTEENYPVYFYFLPPSFFRSPFSRTLTNSKIME